MLYPLTFKPVFQERLWGGRNLERLYDKPLESGRVIGESWEIADRPDVSRVVADGIFAGKDIHWLIEKHGADLLGNATLANGRFPLLVKILDAHEKLSLQVHPPPAKAAESGGEPKTEMWYIVSASPGAELFAGLKNGVTRESFCRHLEEGTVADCFHRISVREGDAIFLPSGRVHAIGGGLVLFEIQQNSDTTYRVFDWNRVDQTGKPRALHIKESLECIDFRDFEPALITPTLVKQNGLEVRELVAHALFHVSLAEILFEDSFELPAGQMHILGVTSGNLEMRHSAGLKELKAGDFCLIPAAVGDLRLQGKRHTKFLWATAGPG